MCIKNFCDNLVLISKFIQRYRYGRFQGLSVTSNAEFFLINLRCRTSLTISEAADILLLILERVKFWKLLFSTTQKLFRELCSLFYEAAQRQRNQKVFIFRWRLKVAYNETSISIIIYFKFAVFDISELSTIFTKQTINDLQWTNPCFYEYFKFILALILQPDRSLRLSNRKYPTLSTSLISDRCERWGNTHNRTFASTHTDHS